MRHLMRKHILKQSSRFLYLSSWKRHQVKSFGFPVFVRAYRFGFKTWFAIYVLACQGNFKWPLCKTSISHPPARWLVGMFWWPMLCLSGIFHPWTKEFDVIFPSPTESSHFVHWVQFSGWLTEFSCSIYKYLNKMFI